MLRIIRERVLPKIGPWSIAGFVAVCLAAAAAILGMSRLRGYVVSLPEFNVESIIIAKPPAWAPQARLIAKIKEAFPEEANMFDRDLLKEVHKSCEDLYWVEQIDSVRKVYPNTLKLKMKLCTPTAYVMYDGDPCLTDRKGKRLQNDYYQPPDGAVKLLNIIGIGGRPPEPGKKWGDHETLMAAIAVVEDIADTEVCYRAGITTVDARNFGGRKDANYSPIVLWTEDQARILWGRSRITPGFDVLTTKEKLANLKKALEKCGDFRRVDYVNVFSVVNQCPIMYRNGRVKR